MRFTKMHGVGNDFIILAPEEVAGLHLPDLARKACDRHFGLGADGILIAAPSEVADLKMIYFNSDGSPTEMCGNGIRCLARYAEDHGLIGAKTFSLETGAGVKEVVPLGNGSFRVDMGPPEFGREVELHGFRFLRVSMGNPHAVAFLGSEAAVEELDLGTVCPPVEKNPAFPEGTNVEFGFARGANDVRMKIWERGVGETLASGSGSCAVAAAAVRLGLAESPVSVRMDGGMVQIEWSGEDEPVFMNGPAEYVCEGELSLQS